MHAWREFANLLDTIKNVPISGKITSNSVFCTATVYRIIKVKIIKIKNSKSGLDN